MKVTKMRLAAAAAALLGATGLAAPALAATHPATTPLASHPCGTKAKPGSYKHIIWIFMENHSYPNIIGSSQAAYVNTVAKECGSATNYHNITHPSLPNYIAATSGLPLSALPGFLPDCSPAVRLQYVGEEHLRPGQDVEVLRGEHAVELRPGQCGQLRGAAQPGRVLHLAAQLLQQ